MLDLLEWNTGNKVLRVKVTMVSCGHHVSPLIMWLHLWYKVSKAKFPMWHFLKIFLLDIFFIYISNSIPKSPVPSLHPAPKPTHSRFLALAFPCTGAYDLHKTKGLSPIEGWLGHPLLHMQLVPWVPPCVRSGWWFSPWELWDTGISNLTLGFHCGCFRSAGACST